MNLGILKTTESNIRTYNVGSSDYSKHIIQPWSVWLEYKLNPWDADIVKRILRTKETDSRKLDYEKIIITKTEEIVVPPCCGLMAEQTVEFFNNN